MSRARRRVVRAVGSLAFVFGVIAIAAPTAAAELINLRPRVVIDPPQGKYSLGGISCPTKNLCATVDNAGRVFVSTNPRGGASAWFKAKETDTHPMFGISCVPTLCVATDLKGAIVYSTHPGSKTAAWSGPTTIDTGNVLESISCPTAHLCVAVDNVGQVFSSTDPTGGPSKWTMTAVNPGAGHVFTGVSCPSTSLCVAVDNHGNAASSTNPAGGVWTLHPGVVTNSSGFNAVSCPSTKLCVGVDQTNTGGDIVTTTQPTSNAAWVVQASDGNFRTPFGVSCPSIRLCLVGDDTGYLFTSTKPTGGKAAWTRSPKPVDKRYGFDSLSCAPTALCVGADHGGSIMAGQLPPPNTQITKTKLDKAKHSASFTFKASGFATGFQCALSRKGAKASFSTCSSPKTYKNLAAGTYTFRVRAINLAGPDPTPASATFTL